MMESHDKPVCPKHPKGTVYDAKVPGTDGGTRRWVCLTCGDQLGDAPWRSVATAMDEVDTADELATIDHHKRWNAQAKEQVRELGQRIGHGLVMELAGQCWRESLVAMGLPGGGEFALGPCVSSLVPCACREQPTDESCAWCAGTGRVTRRVRQAIADLAT